MEWLAKLEENKICDIDNIIHRAKSHSRQAVAQPLRAGADFQAGDAAQRVEVTSLAFDAHLPISIGFERQDGLRRLDRQTGENSNLASDAKVAEPIGAVWSDLEFQNGLGGKEVFDRSAGSGLGRQDEKPLGVLRKAEFLRAAHHALALDSTQLAGLDFKIPRQHSTRKCQWNLVADFIIFGTANDLTRFGRAIVHFANAQAVGIRVLGGLKNLGGDDMVDRCTALVDACDFKPRAAQEVFQFGCRKLAIHIITQPVDGNFHDRIRIVSGSADRFRQAYGCRECARGSWQDARGRSRRQSR